MIYLFSKFWDINDKEMTYCKEIGKLINLKVLHLYLRMNYFQKLNYLAFTPQIKNPKNWFKPLVQSL